MPKAGMTTKTFQPKNPNKNDFELYASFIADLLSGTVKAVKLTESKPAGKLKFDYDDPT